MAGRIFAALDRRVDPRLLALVGSVGATAFHGRPCVVRYDDGLWVHRFRDGTVVLRHPTRVTVGQQDRAVRDVFLFDYAPGAGDTVIDIGAGMGEETRLLSRLVGPGGRVVSIEAHPRTFLGLTKTVAYNGLTNVTPLQCAVTDEPGAVHIEDLGAWALNGLVPDGGRDGAAHGIPVPGRTLGEIMTSLGLGRVDLVKMNIEGAELAALQGSVDALDAVEHLTVSCHDFKADLTGREWERTFAPVCDLLSRHGFAVRTRRDHPSAVIRDYVYASRRRVRTGTTP